MALETPIAVPNEGVRAFTSARIVQDGENEIAVLIRNDGERAFRINPPEIVEALGGGISGALVLEDFPVEQLVHPGETRMLTLVLDYASDGAFSVTFRIPTGAFDGGYYTATVMGCILYTAPTLGMTAAKAVQFNTGDRIADVSGSQLPPSPGIECMFMGWINPDVLTPSRRMILMMHSNGATSGYYVETFGNVLRTLLNAGGALGTSTFTLTPGVWQFFASYYISTAPTVAMWHGLYNAAGGEPLTYEPANVVLSPQAVSNLNARLGIGGSDAFVSSLNYQGRACVCSMAGPGGSAMVAHALAMDAFNGGMGKNYSQLMDASAVLWHSEMQSGGPPTLDETPSANHVGEETTLGPDMDYNAVGPTGP